MKLRNLRPGRFTPKCPRCTKPFHVTIAEDTEQPPVVRALKSEVEKGEATVAPSPPAKLAKPATAEDPNTTGAFQPPAPEEPETTGAFKSAARENPEATGAYQGAAQEESEVTGAYQSKPSGEPSRAAVKEPSAADDDGAVEPFQEEAAAEGPGKKSGTGKSSKSSGKTRAGKAAARDDMPATLGGYQVLKELGRGGMGAVYLGRQLSLDRDVALKVMNPAVAHDPAFVARFTREAFAAAQLVHHNVVQIYDFGAERDIHFFSMEFVRGQSLMDLVRGKGKLDPEVAVGYVLQAARGLKFGHDTGMIHRDVKPDNLLLNDHGIVKVADLGLVKIGGIAETDLPEKAVRPVSKSGVTVGHAAATEAGKTMGTPSYMAPEQAQDASHVDARADIYSLGCTLYVLLTGKPPFQGKTVAEVLTKHASEPIVPPDAVVKRVPKALSTILLRMLAKKPADRYPDMGALIEDLEKYLGIQHRGQFSPKEEHAEALEECVKKFNEAPAARLRGIVFPAFFGVCALAILLCALFGSPLLAGGFLGLALMTPLAYFLANGLAQKTYLFLKVREWLFGCRWSDWLIAAAAVAIFLTVLALFGWLAVWLGFCVLAALLGVGLHFLIDRQLQTQRAEPVEEAEKLFRTLRLQGLDEEALREFVCKYSGRRWEEFYEMLFGYEAKLSAREWVRGEAGRTREKFAAWRDPVVNWIDAKQQARREAEQRRHLKAVEAKALQAEGMDAAEANARAEQVAEVMVTQAAQIKKEARKPIRSDEPTVARADVRALLATARKPKLVYTTNPRSRTALRFERLWARLLSDKVRFLAGAVLLAGGLLWMHQNDLLQGDKLQRVVSNLIEKQTLDLDTKPLQLPGLPEEVGDLFNGFNPAVAGLILIISAFFAGWRVSLLVIPGAAIAFIGHLVGVPAVGPVPAELVSMGAGLGLALLGFIFLRD
jgi:serine/threonine protein kinase